jgi:type 1 glutamine amidotransferase
MNFWKSTFAVWLSLLLINGPAGAAPPKRILLLGQSHDDHPAQEHEYMAGLRFVAELLKPLPDLEVTLVRADDPWKEGPALLDRADAVVLYLAEGAAWIARDAGRRQAFARLAKRGGGITALHWALGTKEAKPIETYLQLLGGCHGGPDRKYQVGDADVHVVDPEFPITRGIQDFRVHDEFYYRLKFAKPESSIHPLLRAPIDGRPETVAWCWERPGGGRSFGFTGLHYHANWRLEAYRRLIVQGIVWTLDRLIPKTGLPIELSTNSSRLLSATAPE